MCPGKKRGFCAEGSTSQVGLPVVSREVWGIWGFRVPSHLCLSDDPVLCVRGSLSPSPHGVSLNPAGPSLCHCNSGTHIVMPWVWLSATSFLLLGR